MKLSHPPGVTLLVRTFMLNDIFNILSGRKPTAFVQVAALCLRPTKAGPEVLLVKTLRTGGWVIPKGWPMPGKTLAEAAACEAWEEAGATGNIGTKPIGSFTYTKIRKSGLPVQCRAQVFLMQTTHAAQDYPEAAKRTRQWTRLDKAAAIVRDAELAKILLDLEKHGA